MATGIDGSTSPADGLRPVLGERALVILHFGTFTFLIAFILIFLYRITAFLQSYCLECVKSLRVIDFQNQARQTAELPRPRLYGNGRSELCNIVAAPPVARGLLAIVADDGLMFRAECPCHLRPRLCVVAVVLP